VITQFLHDRLDVVLDRTNNDTATDYLNGTGIDQKLRQGNVGGGLYFLTDHLSSAILLTSASGSVTERISYEAFGMGSAGSLTRYTYTGREMDTVTELLFYRARWYDPKIGRFISEDPISFASNTTNFYEYSQNSPVNFTDPMGMWSIQLCAAFKFGGCATFGYSDGNTFVELLAGAGVTIGISFDPKGTYSGNPSHFSYIGIGGTAGASLGICNAGVSGFKGYDGSWGAKDEAARLTTDFSFGIPEKFHFGLGGLAGVAGGLRF
jgi:RHS repeat-associated protein